MDTLIKFLWAFLPSLTVGVVLALYNRKQKKRDDRASQREAERVESERLRISLLSATAQLSYAVTMALKRGSTNGEVEPAVEQYEKAMREFRAFEQKQLAKYSAG